MGTHPFLALRLRTVQPLFQLFIVLALARSRRALPPFLWTATCAAAFLSFFRGRCQVHHRTSRDDTRLFAASTGELFLAATHRHELPIARRSDAKACNACCYSSCRCPGVKCLGADEASDEKK